MACTSLQSLHTLNGVYRFLTTYKCEDAVIGHTPGKQTRLSSTATTLGHVGDWAAGAPLPVRGQFTFFKTEEQPSPQEGHLPTLPSTVHHCLLITHQLWTGTYLCG